MNIAEIKSMPVVKTNYTNVLDIIKSRRAYTLSLEVTEDNLKEMKKIRAENNKLKATIETEKKAVTDKLKQPIIEFVEKYKQNIEVPFQEMDDALGKQIKDCENKLIEVKRSELIQFLEEKKLSLNLQKFSNITIELILDKITLSSTISSLKKIIVSKVEKISDELKSIRDMDYNQLVYKEYIKDYNLSRAIIEKEKMIKISNQVSEIKKQQVNVTEEVKEVTEEVKEVTEEVKVITEVEVKKQFTLKFNLTAKEKELFKKFLIENKLEYQQVKGA